MKLTQKAIDAIKTDIKVRARLSLALDRSSFTIDKWIKTNDDKLTKAASLQVIREETGLTDAEILEAAEPTPAQAPAA